MLLSKPKDHISNIPRTGQEASAGDARERVFWRVEGSLLNLTAVRPVGFFAWNSQSFLQRWTRRGGMAFLAIARPFLYCTNRVFATRLLHSVLRGVSRDRLDLLGEEFVEYFLKPRLKKEGVEKLQRLIAAGAPIVLVSQGLDHVMRPLAKHLGVKQIVCNRLDFRDGIATGRLLDPVIRPRGAFAKITGRQADGRASRKALVRVLGFTKNPELLDEAIQTDERSAPEVLLPVVHFDSTDGAGPFSVRESLRGKNILLIGATGFIGKVWLSNLLSDLPEIGRIFLLVRRNRTVTSLQRFRARHRGISGVRAAGRTIRQRLCGVSAQTDRGGGRRCEQATLGPCAGSARADCAFGGRDGQQLGTDGLQSGFARRFGHERSLDGACAEFYPRVRSRCRCCIFQPVT